MSKRTSLLLYLLLTGLLFPAISFAQVVGGQVLSQADQTAVPGVTITVKGTRLGTATDINGKFSIRAKEGDVLVISGIGIARQEMIVGTSGFLNISVATNSRSLSEVVVTATGIKKEAKRLGYSLQTVDASTLTQAREADPINSLKGQAAGLEININQEIGRPADVIMRGENNPVDRPLFVVDGVQISSDTYNLNADDIQNFTVLKGPNAAALYGFQGKNGAIIITTKKGASTRGKMVVTVNSSNQVNKGFIAPATTANTPSAAAAPAPPPISAAAPSAWVLTTTTTTFGDRSSGVSSCPSTTAPTTPAKPIRPLLRTAVPIPVMWRPHRGWPGEKTT